MTSNRQIVCEHCGRLNRLPAGRDAGAARCGACHTPDVSSRLGITGIPKLLLMKRGKQPARGAGAMDTKAIVAWTRTEPGRS